MYNITNTNHQSYNGQVLELGSNGGQEAPVNHGGANNVMLTDRYRHDQSNNGSQNSITCTWHNDNYVKLNFYRKHADYNIPAF